MAAVRAGTAEGVAHKRGLLACERAARSYPAVLTPQFQREARERTAVDVPAVSPGAEAPADGTALWTIEWALVKVTTERSAPSERFRLRAADRMALHRIGQADLVFARSREASSVSSLTTAHGTADDGDAGCDGLDQALQRRSAALRDDPLGQRHVDAIDLRVSAFADRPSLTASEES